MTTKNYLIPFLFGFIGILSFAPFSIKPLIFLSYAYLIKELVYKNKSKFKKLIAWSIGHWGFGMSWIIVSVYYYGNTNLLLSLIVFILLLAILILVFSLPLYVLKIRLFNDFRYEKSIEIFYVSSLLIISEWSMYFLLNGVPWIIPGTIFLDTITQNLYPILGVAGASFFIYFLSTLLASVWIKNKKIAYLIFIPIVILLLPNTPKEKDQSKSINISIVQPSSDPFLKYTSGYKSSIETNLIVLSADIADNSELVVYPEAELPYALESNDFISFIDKLDSSKTIITGAWHFEDKKLYNSMINIDTGQIYNKIHLVPFGEYIPFIASLRGLISFFDMPMSDVNHGKQGQKSINSKIGAFSPLICYDIAFPNTVRLSNISSQFIINISNDTWFGSSIGPYQHLDIARVRAIENNKWLIRSTNDGFSAVIDNNGTIVDKLDKGESGVINSSIKLIEKRTFYNIYGHFIPYLSALLIIFISVIINICLKRRI